MSTLSAKIAGGLFILFNKLKPTDKLTVEFSYDDGKTFVIRDTDEIRVIVETNKARGVTTGTRTGYKKFEFSLEDALNLVDYTGIKRYKVTVQVIRDGEVIHTNDGEYIEIYNQEVG